MPSEAYLTICGLGYFESCINGRKTGDDILSPAFTRYDATVLYMQYDITKLVRSGDNVISVTLGNGWYNCFADDPWNTKAASWRSTPKLICELKVVYNDGRTEKIVSDTSWKYAVYGGPIYFNGIVTESTTSKFRARRLPESRIPKSDGINAKSYALLSESLKRAEPKKN